MSCRSAARRAVLAERAELGGHHRGQVRALDRVREHVLAVARPELQPAEDADRLGVEATDVGIEAGLLPRLHQVALELGLGLVVGLLDPGRVDAPVLQELLERHAGDLAPDAVEAGQDDRVGGVVDDEVDAGEVLEGADVAALTADDAALHVVGGQLDDGDRRLGRVARRHALHHDAQDVADAAIGVALGLLLDLAHLAGALVADLVFQLAQQDLLRLRGAQAGDALELAHVALAQVDDLGLVLLDGRLAGGERRALLVERCLLRQQALLEPHHLGAPLLEVGVCAGRRDCRGWSGRAFPLVRVPGARRESSEAPATRPAASTAAITISIFGSLSSLCSGCARPGSRHQVREGSRSAATSDGGWSFWVAGMR